MSNFGVGNPLEEQYAADERDPAMAKVEPLTNEDIQKSKPESDTLPDEETSNSDPSGSAAGIPDDLLKPYYFGFGSFHPKCLQIFANKKFFTFLMIVFISFQGMIVTGFTSVNVSTLEKRFSFSSTLAGVYVVMYDAFVVVCILFISYFGGKSHKPRVMGISCIVLSIGSIVVASPQFFFGSYKNTNTDITYEECIIGSLSPPDDDCEAANIGAYVILLIGQMLIAIGSTAVYTVAIAYIDEIVYPKYVSLHIGTVLVANAVGPAIGYLLGSALLSVYVDPWRDTELDPSDPAWVGAWWIGPLLTGIFGLLFSVVFFMYPKWLPDSHLVREERAKEMAKTYPKELINKDNLTLVAKQFPIHIKRLLTNPSLMSTAFGLAMLFVIRDGVISFGPKYVESMFGITASTAGLIAGSIGITGAAVGVITGALIVYFWKPIGRQTTVTQCVVMTICVPFVLAFLIKCPTTNVAGITVPYNDGAFDGRDSSMCSMNCSCQSSVYEPVCGSDGITYFSPCRAGCAVSSVDGAYVFENCSCVANISLSVITSPPTNATAVEGKCPNNCSSRLVIFLIILFFLVSLLLTLEIPYYHYALRVVADDQRHLALGLQSAIFRTFGSVPGPLLFGGVVDLSCVEWDYNCGVRGNCWIYDNDELSLNAISLCLPFAVVSVILLFLGMITYPKKPAVNAKDKEQKEDTAI